MTVFEFSIMSCKDLLSLGKIGPPNPRLYFNSLPPILESLPTAF